jgi:hypothetical protein
MSFAANRKCSKAKTEEKELLFFTEKRRKGLFCSLLTRIG